MPLLSTVFKTEQSIIDQSVSLFAWRENNSPRHSCYPSCVPRAVLLPECVVNFTQALHGYP
jgi:hypothetical protein